MRPFQNPAVQEVYDAFPETHFRHTMDLRELILDVAESLQLPDGIDETLKWGEPSYLPVKPRVGSTVRIGTFDDNHIAMYFNCQTMLVENFRTLFGDELDYSKNRAVIFNISVPLPDQEIRLCAKMTLRYHLDKKQPVLIGDD